MGLDQPSAPLVHLTRVIFNSCALLDDGPASPLRLAAAAPRLQVLAWHAILEHGTSALVVEGHPCLRELSLDFAGHISDAAHRKAWLHTIQQLPALSSLAFDVFLGYFESEEPGDDADEAAQAARLCGWLGRCERLEHLKLRAYDELRVRALLAALGAATGSRLRSLHLTAALPQTPTDAAQVLPSLVACYPCLEEPSLRLHLPWGLRVSAANVVWPELLLPASALAPLCPALQEVRVEKRRRNQHAIHYGTWLRPSM